VRSGVAFQTKVGRVEMESFCNISQVEYLFVALAKRNMCTAFFVFVSCTLVAELHFASSLQATADASSRRCQPSAHQVSQERAITSHAHGHLLFCVHSTLNQ
jgi:hypothetical protein